MYQELICKLQFSGCIGQHRNKGASLEDTLWLPHVSSVGHDYREICADRHPLLGCDPLHIAAQWCAHFPAERPGHDRPAARARHGRQLDGVPASLRVLPEVVSAVNGQAEVWMDGGIRRGTDIVKAMCLGARAVLCGRAYAYGLAAAGEAGVTRAIDILRTDLDRTLRLLGCPAIAALDRSYVNVPKSWI